MVDTIWVVIYLGVIVANLGAVSLAAIAVRTSRGLMHFHTAESPGYYRRRAWGWMAFHLLLAAVAVVALIEQL